MNPVTTGVLAFAVIAVIGVFAGVLFEEWRRWRVRARLPSCHSQNAQKSAFSFANKNVQICAAVFAFLFGLTVDGVVLGILLTGAGVLAWHWYGHMQQRKQLRTYDRHLLRVLDFLVLSLNSGAGLTVAIREASVAHNGLVEDHLKAIVCQLDSGADLKTAMNSWTRLCPLRSVKLTVACMTLAFETGGSVATSISTIRQTVRNAIAAESSALTFAEQARSSALLLAALPLLLTTPMLIFNESARAFMLHSPLGIAFLVLGLLLELLGIKWMSRMIERVV